MTKASGLMSTDMPDKTVAPLDPFSIARSLKSAVWIFDIDHARICFANAAACELWQARDEAELYSRDMGRDMTSAVAERLGQYQQDFLEHDSVFTDVWTLYPKGKPTSVRVTFCGVLLEDGRMAMLCEGNHDVSTEPDNLRSAEALLRTDVMITLYERDGAPLYMNPAARSFAASPRQTISEKFVSPQEYQDFCDNLDAAGEHKMVALVHTDQGQFWHDLVAKTCRDAVTGDPAILVTEVDVTALKTARDTARYLADRDQLTGCFNRTFLQNAFSGLPVGQNAALVCFDVDHFKQVNDRFGHEMGDFVLREIVARISAFVQSDDLLVRLGGDEFVILIGDAPSPQWLADRLDEAMKKIAEPLIHDATRMPVSVSMGALCFRAGADDCNEALKKADMALYASKQSGRNRLTFFSEEMGRAASEREQIETELKDAIVKKEFCLHYQPQYSMHDGKVTSVEGLVRWQHPNRGLLMPGAFVPVCEETGMIEDLGQQVLEAGCSQAMAWHRAGVDLQVSVNISPRQFSDPGLMPMLKALSGHPDFPSGKITLEVTESVLIGDLAEIGRKLDEISKLGFRIAIDDFGTGYSNLTYISTFPVDCLKIDRSFISQLPKSGPVITLIITLARQIGATVIAEGVETSEQLAWLKDQGCDQVQGFLMSRAKPICDLAQTIEALNSTDWFGVPYPGRTP